MASRFGLLHLNRQVCVDPHTQSHTLPGNAVLPPHAGMIITRGLQEWCCLLPQELSFEPAARLLGWQTSEDKVLCATTIRTLVRTHGQIIRQAEQAEVATLLERDDLTTLRPQLMPVTTPRRRAGWPKELSAAVDLALAAGVERPPQGIRQADWERVLDARRQEAVLTLEELRHLGPVLEPAQVLLTIDSQSSIRTQRQGLTPRPVSAHLELDSRRPAPSTRDAAHLATAAVPPPHAHRQRQDRASTGGR